MPNELSSVVPTALSSGAQKLGQPVRLSNFVPTKTRQVAAGAGEGSRAMLVIERAGERPLGGRMPQHGKLARS